MATGGAAGMIVTDLSHWLSDSSHWSGPDGVPTRLREHLQYSLLALLIAAAIAIPLGLLIGHTRRGTFAVVAIANSFRALPAVGLLTYLYILIAPHIHGTGSASYFIPSEIVLILLGIPSMLSNTYAGIDNVDPGVKDAAQGMGMRGSQVLWKVEVPNALPLIFSGVRASFLQVIATAIITAYVGLGGFGRLLLDGLASAGLSADGLRRRAGRGAGAGGRSDPGTRAALRGVPRCQRPLLAPAGRGPGRAHDDHRGLDELSVPSHHYYLMSTDRGDRQMKIVRGLTAIAASAGLLVLAACGSSSNPTSPGSGGGGAGSQAPSDTIVVGSANFQENVVLADIYADALKAKGVKVSTKLNIGSRETYIPALKDGSIDLIPEYSGVLLQYFDKNATAVSSADVLRALQKALPSSLAVLDQSQAEDKDAIVVKKETADKYNLKSIADLASVAGKLTLGGPPEFQTRADGVPGLKKLYNVTFKTFRKLDAGGPLTENGLKNGQIDAGDIFTTDPLINQNGWVVLDDPKNLYTAQNVLPLINSTKASDAVKSVLNAVSAKLTTDDLVSLNQKVQLDKQDPDAVAKAWLQSAGIS